MDPKRIVRPQHAPRNNRYPRKTKRFRDRWLVEGAGPNTNAKSRTFHRKFDALRFAERFTQWKADHDQPLAWIVVEEQEIAILSPWREVS